MRHSTSAESGTVRSPAGARPGVGPVRREYRALHWGGTRAPPRCSSVGLRVLAEFPCQSVEKLIWETMTARSSRPAGPKISTVGQR